jgi:hypothetical protein
MNTGEVAQLWQRALFAMLLAGGVLAFGRGRPSAGSGRFEISTTVVANDATDLNCDSTLDLNGQRCAFASGRQVAQLDDHRVLRPFVSVQGEVVLLAGVFQSPRVSEWLGATRARHGSERVRLDCRATYLGSFEKVGVRWRDADKFEARENVRAARIEACRVEALP